MDFTKKNLVQIIDDYYSEFSEFSYELAKKYHKDNQENNKGAFGDLEGLIIYSLIREYKPKIIFEISPDTGMSTNYILQAVAKNSFGKVYGFEIEKTKYKNPRKPTLEAITNNQINPDFVSQYYSLVIGDATKECDLKKYGNPDIILIDSCHEKWFSEWYVNNLLPNVNYFSILQDISYSHMIELSSEADFVVENLKKKNFFLLDNLRSDFTELTDNHYPIRNLMINSILLGGNKINLISSENFPNKDVYLKAKMNKSLLKNSLYRGKLLNLSFPGGKSQFAATYLSRCLSYEENNYLFNYIYDCMFGSIYQSQNKVRDIERCFINLLKGLLLSKKKFSLIKAILKMILLFPINSIRAIFSLFIRVIRLNN
ncbi:hypothetical protein OA313_01330 [Candidatus Pelagibacter sp.]|nr:hypothetical protein [Candidatus Pelagibacter sp.]